jgi:hydrogenase maturation protein HypF
MAAGILYNIAEIEEWLISQINQFPHGEKEVEIIIKQLKKGSGAKTTSCGRVLDAVSAILGICYERTYEGEPALKLESAAIRGVDILNLTPKLEGDIINTTYLVHEIFTKKKEYSIADLAYSAQSYLARALAYSAMEKARRLDINTIGFSGGVAYNECITQVIKSTLEKNDIKFLIHNQIPPGDGGISFGQTMAISHLT